MTLGQVLQFPGMKILDNDNFHVVKKSYQIISSQKISNLLLSQTTSILLLTLGQVHHFPGATYIITVYVNINLIL